MSSMICQHRYKGTCVDMHLASLVDQTALILIHQEKNLVESTLCLSCGQGKEQF